MSISNEVYEGALNVNKEHRSLQEEHSKLVAVHVKLQEKEKSSLWQSELLGQTNKQLLRNLHAANQAYQGTLATKEGEMQQLGQQLQNLTALHHKLINMHNSTLDQVRMVTKKNSQLLYDLHITTEAYKEAAQIVESQQNQQNLQEDHQTSQEDQQTPALTEISNLQSLLDAVGSTSLKQSACAQSYIVL